MPTDPARLSPLRKRSARRDSFPSAFDPVSMPCSVDHGDAGAVVAAVLEAPERIENDGNAIALTDVSYDPAHMLLAT